MANSAAKLTFGDFMSARSGSLLRTALLLSGQDRAEAEDLLALALARARRNWSRVRNSDEPERYVRAILASASTDRLRQAARRRLQTSSRDDAGSAAADKTGEAGVAGERCHLLRAMTELPPRQRAVLVLRYFDDLSAGEIAQMLGCSLSAVQRQATRGLARLHEKPTSPVSARPRDGTWASRD